MTAELTRAELRVAAVASGLLMLLDEHGITGQLVRVALAAGLTFELAYVEYPATRGRERRLKNQGGAARRCPLCRGTAGPLDPFQAADVASDPTTGRRR